VWSPPTLSVGGSGQGEKSILITDVQKDTELNPIVPPAREHGCATRVLLLVSPALPVETKRGGLRWRLR
jgi:hypothetical protein